MSGVQNAYPVRKAYPKSFVVYREQMLRLLAYPKLAWDQLCLELPTLMGFRASEVGTWKAEYINFDEGYTFVYDAKKHKRFVVPLNIQVAAHAEAVLNGRSSGYVLRHRSNAWRGREQPLTNKGIWDVWRKYSKLAGLPNWREFTPLTGRRWFACEWFHRQKKSLLTLSKIMRHTHPAQTLSYVDHLVFWEDVLNEYKEFQFSFIAKNIESPRDELKQLLNSFYRLFNQRLKALDEKESAKAVATW